jgi:hypothetical protein
MRGRSFGLLHVAVATALTAGVVACAHPARLTIYDASVRPAGYHWIAHRIGDTGTFEYYGVDPVTAWTVYVGPDGIYYAFPHAPPIGGGDLRSYWDPHDAPVSASGSSRDRPRAGRLRNT